MTNDTLATREPDIPIPSLADVKDAIRVLFEADQIVELRGLGIRGATTPKKFILSGYYDDHERLAEDAVKMASRLDVIGTYVTLQQLNPAVLLRCPNKFREAKGGDCASDADVFAYRFLPIDLDPRRAAGISSSDAEKSEARAVLTSVAAFFESFDVRTIQGDSGNGFHDLARIDLPVSDKALVQRTLAAISDRFSTDTVDIDLSVFNPSRIWKLYGTVSRKGFSSVARPHRSARLVAVPETPLEPVSRELLEKIAEEIPAEGEKKEGKKATAHELDWANGRIEEFMFEARIEHGKAIEYKDGFKWVLDKCVFNREHTGGCAIVTMAGSSALGYRCLHNSCFGKKWADFRKYGEGVIGHEFEFREQAAPIDPKAIVVNPGHLGNMIRASEKVLFDIGLKYFERGGLLVNSCYGRDLPEEKRLKRALDSVIIQTSSDESIVRDLDQGATFVRRKQTAIGAIDKVVDVPGKLPAQLKDRVRSEPRSVPFLTLDMVTGSPVLLPSGKVHEILMPHDGKTPRGSIYEERVLFVGGGEKRFPTIKEHPTQEDAIAALKQFEQVFHKFPFVDPKETREWNQTASYSVVLSGILSLVGRPFVGLHAIPLHAVSAPLRRSGKTLIVEAACMCGVGHSPTPAHFSDETELGKHLHPLVQSADRAILLDNIERALSSSKLCILITAGALDDRVLQESRSEKLQNFSIFWATGNNLVISGDLTARSLLCRINPNVEQPEGRAFKFSPMALAHELHPQLVMSALTALRAFLLANSPWTLKRQLWGGFEEYDSLISGCLVWCGYRDPYETRQRIIDADPIRTANAGILEDWYTAYGSITVSFAKLKKDAGEVFDALCYDGHWDGFHALHILTRLADQPIGGYRLEKMEGRSRWRVVKADAEGNYGPNSSRAPEAEEPPEPQKKIPF